jgi:hypothetical protein
VRPRAAGAKALCCGRFSKLAAAQLAGPGGDLDGLHQAEAAPPAPLLPPADAPSSRPASSLHRAEDAGTGALLLPSAPPAPADADLRSGAGEGAGRNAGRGGVKGRYALAPEAPPPDAATEAAHAFASALSAHAVAAAAHRHAAGPREPKPVSAPVTAPALAPVAVRAPGAASVAVGAAGSVRLPSTARKDSKGRAGVAEDGARGLEWSPADRLGIPEGSAQVMGGRQAGAGEGWAANEVLGCAAPAMRLEQPAQQLQLCLALLCRSSACALPFSCSYCLLLPAQ